jgi:hypothetical protein
MEVSLSCVLALVLGVGRLEECEELRLIAFCC